MSVSRVLSPRRFLNFLVLVCLLTGVSACSRDSGLDYLENYQARLVRVLNIEVEDSVSSVDSLNLPDYHWGFRGQWLPKAEHSVQSISVLDFLSLYGCDIQLVIAENNSGLGKFAPSSQRLLRELRFLHHAPVCIASLKQNNEDDLAAQLQRELGVKSRRLPFLVWHALLNEDEARSFWRAPASLGDYPAQVSLDPELAVSRLLKFAEQWLSGGYLAGHDELESVLSVLRTGDGGSLLASLQLLQDSLAKLDRLLAQYLDAETCENGRAKIDPDVLQNVVSKFFVAEVQVWSSGLSRRVYGLLNLYQALEQFLSEYENDNYARWRKQRDEFVVHALKASAKHVRLLQKAMAMCGGGSA